MELTCFILILVAFVFYQFWKRYTTKIIQNRNLHAEYSLIQIKKKFPLFDILWSLIACSLFYPLFSLLYLIGMAIIFTAYYLIDFYFYGKMKRISHFLDHNRLIENSYKEKYYNLELITRIEFHPFTDIIEVCFQTGKSAFFERQKYEKQALGQFLRIAIAGSHLPVVIDPDAQSKL